MIQDRIPFVGCGEQTASPQLDDTQEWTWMDSRWLAELAPQAPMSSLLRSDELPGWQPQAHR